MLEVLHQRKLMFLMDPKDHHVQYITWQSHMMTWSFKHGDLFRMGRCRDRDGDESCWQKDRKSWAHNEESLPCLPFTTNTQILELHTPNRASTARHEVCRESQDVLRGHLTQMMAIILWTHVGSPHLAHLQTALFALVSVTLFLLSNRCLLCVCNSEPAVHFFGKYGYTSTLCQLIGLTIHSRNGGGLKM